MKYATSHPFRPALCASVLLALGMAACSSDSPPTEAGSPTTGPLFRALSAEESGITFVNALVENEDVNYFNYEYMYNGGGVAIGDLNNDGLQDIYLTGCAVGDKLYLNRGGLKFEDVTERVLPHTGDHGWHTGVTMADVNNDGLLDIYVCRAGRWPEPQRRTNLYFECAGIGPDGLPTYLEKAAALGIADTTRSTQALFFDLDGDNDLDLFVLNTPLQGRTTLSIPEVQELIRSRRSPSSRLYRNDGVRFTDITAEAGLWSMGFGLGVATSDLDADGRPDLYVANDYIEPDKMYMQYAPGRFRDEVLQRTRHISNFGMGCDVADYDNDGLMDIMVLDMVSADHVRSKKNMSGMDPKRFNATVEAGYHHQYMFNTLQRNNGNGTFSEVGQMAGVSKTDWSWAPLFADLDNDGWKDLLVTNGYKRDMRDNDFSNTLKKLNAERRPMDANQLLALIPATKLRNYLFCNAGADSAGLARLTFADSSAAWGFTQPMNSNGAAYADLDNDGDLDLVISNIDEPSLVYENRAVQQGRGNWLRVRLQGSDGAQAMLTRVHVTTPAGTQVQELQPTRGFQSRVESILHFGLGPHARADQVQVHWPGGMVSTLRDVAAGQVIDVKRDGATTAPPLPALKPLLVQAADALGANVRHSENAYDDFAVEVLLPHRQSRNGPLLGVGDANGDGRDDVYVGGARGQRGTLLLQTADGRFAPAPSQPWEQHKDREDMGSLFLDVDGDGDQDLLVLSGSNEVDLYFDQYHARLYRNEGAGRFTHAQEALPPLQTSALRAATADIDGDGDLDLFIGGRITPGQYPRAPRSYLLVNDGTGRFTDATAENAPGLMQPGLVTAVCFTDMDRDGDPDLVLAGEWMPLTFFTNQGGRFTDATTTTGLTDTQGWWWNLVAADLDGDGDEDLVAGNIGWNNKFHGTPEKPLHLYWNDFDGNGRGDIVLAKDQDGIRYPVRGRECSSQQCPMILDRFPTYDAFARASLETIYTPEKLGNALHLEVRNMMSCVLLNQGNGRYVRRDLPMLAQAAPIMGIAVHDVTGDGKPDLVVAGNHWGAEVETIRYDAGTGLVLEGDGRGNFTPWSIARSGFFAWDDVRDVRLVQRSGHSPVFFVASNNAPLSVFTLNAMPQGMATLP
ncbi:MAG: VCBS repeat-containing protein [Flavobacteriales bacterium]|nr:VCBS repeat-containing protein [Flavobacteriales bacterium]